MIITQEESVVNTNIPSKRQNFSSKYLAIHEKIGKLDRNFLEIQKKTFHRSFGICLYFRGKTGSFKSGESCFCAETVDLGPLAIFANLVYNTFEEEARF